MSNETNTVLYTGFTSDLHARVYAHKEKLVDGFTKKYNVNKLVYYEVCESREGALWREKQIKSASRQKKMDLIDELEGKFLEGAEKNKIDRKLAEDLYSMIKQYAEYAFNKSHSAAYALVTYQTAYLKAHFPLEYMEVI